MLYCMHKGGMLMADERDERREERTLAVYLREVMGQGQFSLRAVARAAGVSPTTVHNVLAGRFVPSPPTIGRLAAFLGVSELDLLRLAGHVPAERVEHSVREALVRELSRELHLLPHERALLVDFYDFLRARRQGTGAAAPTRASG